MNQKSDLPNVYDFGDTFNYAVWTKDTALTFVNVRWNNDYRDVVKFNDKAALNTYIDAQETISGIRINNLSYIKPNTPIRIDVPFNAAYKYNYLRASNPVQPFATDVLKDFYYFITDVRYIAPNTTEIVVQLDIFQTFIYDVTFGNCYIERGHIGIANENAFDNFGRDYLTVPEGLDIGGEYVQVARKTDKIFDMSTMDILVASTVEFNDTGDVTNPVLKSSIGSKVQGMPSGASYYVFRSIDEFTTFLDAYKDFPWITQGIISITAIPDISRYHLYASPRTSAHGITFYRIGGFGESVGTGKYTSLYADWRNDTTLLNEIPLRYRHLKKLFTYPYMVIEMTTWSATPIVIKPESWADDDATINEKISMLPPNQKIVIYPRRYNAKADSTIVQNGLSGSVEFGGPTVAWTEYYDDGGEYLDMATIISNFPTMALINNMAIGYMAANAHGIAFQSSSADWVQQRALAGNQTSYDQQSSAINTSENVNRLQRAGMGASVASNQLALLQGTAAQGAASVIGGALSNPLSGLAGGVKDQIMGGVMAGISVDQSNRQNTIDQTVSNYSNQAQNQQAGYVRDTNKSLADWAARGDYANAIGAINAKVQDIKLTQPSTSGQIGGEAFNIINNAAEVSLRWKLVNGAAMRTIGDYWLRFGYAVQKFGSIPANFKAMSKFTYWKLQETYIISAPMPESFKQAIRGIFEKGVTVWSNPSDIGNIDISDNEPVGGITL